MEKKMEKTPFERELERALQNVEVIEYTPMSEKELMQLVPYRFTKLK